MATASYPPGPRLPRLVQTLLFARRRQQFEARVRRRYGDTFTLRLVPPFAGHLVVFSRPEHIREIFAADPADLHAGEGNGLFGPIVGDRSVLVTDEAEHARARRLLMPAFTGSALHGYRELVAAIAKDHIDEWVSQSTLPALARMNDLTLDVIMQVVLGVTEERRRAELAPRLRRVIQLDPIVFYGLAIPQLRRIGPWKRFYAAVAELDRMLYAEIAHRRAQAHRDPRADVLSRLLAVGSGENPADAPLSDEELRDQLVTLLLAGHETTSSALAWAFHELAAAPEVQRRARHAACEGDDKYLEAVLKEAMRRRTVISAAIRRVNRDMTLGGWELPEGTYVITSIVLAHQDPAHHPDSDTFRPERFLDGSVAANTWLPFGGGVRRCIGAGFALMEGTAVLREALSRYTLSLPPGAAPERGRLRNITTVPADGARVLVVPNGSRR
ncbi:cytochrome P450 [Nocardia transvalensis]|uniref:cytochrome P450 n=1 Tax=Nocardia transvalensis TaxID=37333 RepID=UPI00189415BF|nr:cytochrome P450 [Nocardia transvalensis]MBF6328113.1 cytochrome P450 [Nocardia transvalensis]